MRNLSKFKKKIHQAIWSQFIVHITSFIPNQIWMIIVFNSSNVFFLENIHFAFFWNAQKYCAEKLFTFTMKCVIMI